MIDERLEELAALHALGLLDEAGESELLAAASRDPEVRELIDQMAEAAAALALDAPQVAPPPAVWRELKRQLPARRTAEIVTFPIWVPYALAACLCALALAQGSIIFSLQKKVHAVENQAEVLRQSNDMVQLKLAMLEAKDAAYAGAKVMVAWDPHMHRGMITTENMPAPPPGHDYQLWVLDPGAPAPVNAGLLRGAPGGQHFQVQPMAGSGPGFAISLEPSGGRPEPTGAILFAVAPGG